MKEALISKEALKIFNAIEHRIEELWDKAVKGTLNPAYQIAFTVGVQKDIDNILKKLKIKRNMVKFKNVQEMEMSDIEPVFKMERIKPQCRKCEVDISEKDYNKYCGLCEGCYSERMM